MRNPRRHRNIAFVLTAIFGSIMIAGLRMRNNHSSMNLQATFVMGGMIDVVLPLCWLFYSQFELGRYDRLVRGKDVLARWTIDAQT